MKTLTVDGRLTRDAESKVSKDGRNYVKFSIAHNDFANGEEVTEYYDVCVFDTFTIDKRLDFLKKGRYVIVQGNYDVRPNVKDGKLYINHWVNASYVDFPRIGGKKQEGQEDGGFEGASTYSGQAPYQKPQAQTLQQAQIQMPQIAPMQQPQPQAMPRPQVAPQPQVMPQPQAIPVQQPQAMPRPQVASQPQAMPRPQVAPQPQAMPQMAPQFQPAAQPQQGFTAPDPGFQSMEDDDDLPF